MEIEANFVETLRWTFWFRPTLFRSTREVRPLITICAAGISTVPMSDWTKPRALPFASCLPIQEYLTPASEIRPGIDAAPIALGLGLAVGAVAGDVLRADAGELDQVADR